MRKKNLFLLVISVLVSFGVVGQKLKKVTIKHNNPAYSEVYSVLKNDQEVKHGNYQKLGYKKSLVINGYYNKGLKDSLWTEYFWNTDIIKNQGNYLNDEKTGVWLQYYKIGEKSVLKSKGEYANNNKIGVWEFYNNKSELIQKYNFDNNKLIYFKPIDEEYEIKTDSGLVKTKLDRPPLYIGGKSEASKALLEANLRYPSTAMENQTSGTVYISFFISEKGIARDYNVETGIGDGCDEEALRVVKQIPNNWLPGYLNGRPVETKYIYPINFKLM